MNAGKLDRRILVQVRVETQDGMGGRVETWATAFQCWAGLLKNGGKTSTAADAERPANSRSFLMRFREDISAADNRIIYKGKTYEITALLEDGRNDALIADCRQLEGLEL